MKQVCRLLGLLLLLALCASGCTVQRAQLQDGYYSAEAASFDNHGWKEYVTIYVSGERIITVEYNAKNVSGFIKSWDMNYMREMNATDGTYPNQYTREYASALLSRQNPAEVDAVTGATHSHAAFQLLAEAAIGQSKAGDKNIAYVEIPVAEEAS